MAKIMLVEDDNSLREIYEARLAAEGYTVVSAKDGEEALALALKERPDLIIADIMMPKVSGFDMLDILRSTPETKDTKIIMMTALSQAEDKARAESLGADKYLVKSQVTLEDVTREAKDMLATIAKDSDQAVSGMIGDNSAPADPAQSVQPTTQTANQPSPQPTVTPASTPEPPAAAAVPAKPTDDTTSSSPAVADPVTADAPATPAVSAIPVTTPPEDEKSEPQSETTTTNESSDDVASTAPSASEDTTPAATAIPVTEVAETESETESPATDVEPLEQEAKDLSAPVEKEKEDMDEQMDEFIASNPTLSSSPDTDTPETPIDEGSKSPDTASGDADSPTTNPSTDKNEDEADGNIQKQSYVGDDDGDKDKPSTSLEHTKIIEPIPDTDGVKPKLEDLLANETDDTSTSPPPISSVITPEQPSDN